MKGSNPWWLLTLAGGIFILVGIFCFISPLNAYLFLIHYFGIALLINGILLMIVSYKSSAKLKEKKWLLAESVVDIFFAAFLLFNPFMSFVAFSLIIGPWMISKGFLKAAAALKLRTLKGWAFIFLAGILSVFFGFLIMFYPLKKANGITVFIGLFAIVMGTLYIFESIRYKNSGDTLDLVL